MNIVCQVGKGLAMCLLMCGSMCVTHAQTGALVLKNGKSAVRKIFQPRKKVDADLYYLKLRRGQLVKIKVVSNEMSLGEENSCGIYFELLDGQSKKMFLGDSPAGIDDWEGEIKETGNHQIKVFMSCLESFTAIELRKKKPLFRYSLTVQVKR